MSVYQPLWRRTVFFSKLNRILIFGWYNLDSDLNRKEVKG
jgi:hypothetical protein